MIVLLVALLVCLVDPVYHCNLLVGNSKLPEVVNNLCDVLSALFTLPFGRLSSGIVALPGYLYFCLR